MPRRPRGRDRSSPMSSGESMLSSKAWKGYLSHNSAHLTQRCWRHSFPRSCRLRRSGKPDDPPRRRSIGGAADRLVAPVRRGVKVGIATEQGHILDSARDAGLSPDRLRDAFVLLDRWIADGVIPGAAV